MGLCGAILSTLISVNLGTHGYGPRFRLGVRGLNGVAVAQNGLIFGEDEATGSGKVSGWLRGLLDTIYKFKNGVFPENLRRDNKPPKFGKGGFSADGFINVILRLLYSW